VHLPDIQLTRSDIAVVLDTDSDAAIATRKRVLTMAQAEGLLVSSRRVVKCRT
jgi:hypothetical protein